jgi:methyltransferase family protein
MLRAEPMAMRAASVERLTRELGEDDLVLDVGGWIQPFTRANWVIDLMPYETRGEFGTQGELPERFTSETWVQRDICDHEPWPFEDRQFDFVVCTHTLEDVRDPVWVCSEIARVGKAGYIEVPSRLEEQSYGFQGPWTGWGHHRWLIDVDGDRIDFVFKHAVVHNRDSDRFPPGFQQALSPEQRVLTVWWEGSFEARERVFTSAEELDPYVAGFVSRHRRDVPLPRASAVRRMLEKLRRLRPPRGGS